MTTPNTHLVKRLAREGHRLIASQNVTLWASLWTALSGTVRQRDVEHLVEIADGDIEALEAAAHDVTSRYDDAAAIGVQKLLRRAVLHALSTTQAREQHSRRGQ
jgi:hypothetical protein